MPGVAPGHVDLTVKIASNTQTEAEQVLNNSADVFDWADQLPPSLVPQVTSQAADRYKQQNTISTFYFFLNTQAKPFNNQLAREAVNLRRSTAAPSTASTAATSRRPAGSCPRA